VRLARTSRRRGRVSRRDRSAVLDEPRLRRRRQRLAIRPILALTFQVRSGARTAVDALRPKAHKARLDVASCVSDRRNVQSKDRRIASRAATTQARFVQTLHFDRGEKLDAPCATSSPRRTTTTWRKAALHDWSAELRRRHRSLSQKTAAARAGTRSKVAPRIPGEARLDRLHAAIDLASWNSPNVRSRTKSRSTPRRGSVRR